MALQYTGKVMLNTGRESFMIQLIVTGKFEKVEHMIHFFIFSVTRQLNLMYLFHFLHD